MKRQHTRLLVGVAALALLAAGCGGDDDDDDATSDTTGSSGGASVDVADLTLGGPADCENNGYCLPGLERVYGVDLSGNFTALDAGLVIPSLEDGSIDIGVTFSTDAVLNQEGLVVLEDDEGMTAADNIFPVATQEVSDAYGDDLAEVLDAVSAEITTEHDVDHEDAEDIASDWLSDHSDLEGLVEAPSDGPALTFGIQDFGESEVLAQIYSTVLQANGYESGTADVGGYRDLLFAAFDSGDVNIALDYVASELEYLNENAGEATADLDETFGLLEPLLGERGLVAYTPTEARNVNVFVVTEDWSSENGVTKLSDLAG
jgi:glycine betaine/choline ABC-type transport system substrate-binding protein